VHANRRAVAPPDVELALPRASGGRPLADLAREADLCFGITRSTIDRPVAASAAMRNSCSAAEFQTATRRSVSVTTTAAGAWPITSAATISSMTRMAPRAVILIGSR